MSTQAARAPVLGLGRHFNVTRELAITQFKLKYTGSVLGYVWSLVKPAMIFGIMYLVFAVILKIGHGVTDWALQLLVGVVLWTFFAETTSISVSSIISNGSLVQRAFFPRSILVIATSASAAMTFLINMALIIIVAGALGQLSLGVQSLLAVPLIIELYLLMLGAALLLSALFVFFRDLAHAWEILLQVFFYASGVMFPLVSLASESSLRHLLLLAPTAQIIEDIRHVLVTPSAPWTAELLGESGGAWQIIVPIGITFMVFGAGSLVFRALAPRFAENL
jgi:ABC-2 type transport system permease protein